MSMTGEFQRISRAEFEGLLERMRDDPEAFADYLDPDTRRFDPPGLKFSIGKAWHGLHYLLNGHSHEVTSPVGGLVLGGREVGADSFYGPVRYLTPEQVRAIAVAAGALTEEQFHSRFDAGALNAAGVYPMGKWGHAEDLPYLWRSFEGLRVFYREAAYFGDALLLYVG